MSDLGRNLVLARRFAIGVAIGAAIVVVAVIAVA
jgi:hypothetical protein